jgi:hypothetical protein
MVAPTVADGAPMDGNADLTSPPAVGWYPDPARPEWEHLWDGSTWVGMVRPARGGQIEPNPARWQPDPHNSARERLWGGEAWTACTRLATSHDRGSEPPPGSAGEAAAPQRAKHADSSKPRRLATLGTVAAVLLAFTILANLAILIANQRFVGLESDVIGGGIPDFPRLKRAADESNTASNVYVVAVLIAGVGFMAWLSRAYRNLPRRGFADLRFGPGWAIGAWFVPILNLFRPKQIANDVWRGSDGSPERDSLVSWRERRVAPLVHWWWGCLIFGSVLSRVSSFIIRSANNDAGVTLDTLRTERVGIYIDQVASIALIVAAVLAIQTIVRVSNMQDGDPAAEGAVQPAILPGAGAG